MRVPEQWETVRAKKPNQHKNGKKETEGPGMGANKKSSSEDRPSQKGGKERNGIKALRALIPNLQNRDKPQESWARITAKPSSKHTIGNLQRIFDPNQEGIEIAVTHRRSDEKQLIVRTETLLDLEKLQDSRTLREEGFEVERLTAKLPKIIIYDINSDLTKDRINEEIRSKNECVGRSPEGDFKLLFHINSKKKGLVRWVAETTAQIRRTIMENSKKKIKIVWSILRTDDYLDAPRCFHCQRYGHIAKHCTQKSTTCGHCGQPGRRHKDCLDRDKPPVCTPCKIAGRASNHEVHSKDCPSKLRAITERMRNTSYAC